MWYIEFVCRSLVGIVEAEEKVYSATNPFDFMDMISLQGNQFLQREVGEYQKKLVLHL
jgi:hypothetical protein